MSDLEAAVQKVADELAANPVISTETAERHWVGDGRWIWRGSMNGFDLSHLTADPDLRPELRPFRAKETYGVQMVSQDGELLNHQFRCW